MIETNALATSSASEFCFDGDAFFQSILGFPILMQNTAVSAD